MSNFLKGFEKAATSKEEKAKKREKGTDALKTFLGGSVLSGLATTPLFAGGLALDKRMSEKEVEQIRQAVKERRGVRPGLYLPEKGLKGDFMSNYNPMSDTVTTSQAPRTGILAHELGHASNLKKTVGSVPKILRRSLPYQMGMMGGTIAPAIFGASDDEATQKIAPYTGAIAATPVLLEEGRASLKGLSDIKKTFGGKRMLRAIPGLAGAFSTYAAPPVISGYLAKRYIDKRKAREESKKS